MQRIELNKKKLLKKLGKFFLKKSEKSPAPLTIVQEEKRER